MIVVLTGNQGLHTQFSVSNFNVHSSFLFVSLDVTFQTKLVSLYRNLVRDSVSLMFIVVIDDD